MCGGMVKIIMAASLIWTNQLDKDKDKKKKSKLLKISGLDFFFKVGITALLCAKSIKIH